MRYAEGVALTGILAVCIQIFAPQNPIFHSTWYDVGLLALLALVLGAWRSKRIDPLQAGGAAIVLFAGLACGLLAPDPQTVVGAPGASVQVADAGGMLHFPLVPDRDGTLRASFSSGANARTIGPGRTLFSSFEMWPVDRTVVSLDVRDDRGGRVTITQPTGAAFLSPVLLLEGRTQIAGMRVPVDSFAVPARGLVVKAVYFAPQQSAQLRGANHSGKPSILFAVSDESDRLMPNGLGLIADGGTKLIGGLRLAPVVEHFPAVAIAAVPNLPALAVGIAAYLAGMLRPLRSRSRSKT